MKLGKFSRQDLSFVTKVRVNLVIFLFLLVTVVTSSFIGFHQYSENHQPKLPPIPSHPDIPQQPLLTFQKSLLVKTPVDLSAYQNSTCAPLAKNWVAQENKKPGLAFTMNDWAKIDISNPYGSVLWLNKTSVSCGETVDIHASLYSTHSPDFVKGDRTIAVIRIGWYNGSGGREIWRSQPTSLKAERIPFASSGFRMIETKWKTTLSLHIGNDWKPGFYLVTTISPTGKIEGAAPLIVRSPTASSSLVLVHSTLTWTAYNIFGGRSLYFGPGNTPAAKNAERSRVSSMDRPIVGSGAIHIQRDGIALVQYLEMEGFNVDQIADTDLDQWPSLATNYHGMIFSGHAEYFTRREFQATMAARNNGVNLLFLGGNTAYWQTRVAASPSGKYRHVIVYRDAKTDPIINPYQATIQFADKRINTPGSLLTGGTTEGVHVYGDLYPYEIPNWLHIPVSTELIGWASDSEIEGMGKGKAEPPNVHIIFEGMMKLCDAWKLTATVKGRIPRAQSIWFTTPSGAAVFNAGITLWPCDLLPSCSVTRMIPSSRASLQEVTRQILLLWQQKEIGRKLQ